jgi:hypothetical protein
LAVSIKNFIGSSSVYKESFGKILSALLGFLGFFRNLKKMRWQEKNSCHLHIGSALKSCSVIG